jgi:hypothetical protein
MGAAQGYGKIVTSGLVFAYDTGDTRNSYKGEPTTNIVTNPTFLGTPNTQSFAVPGNWYFSGDTSATGFRFYNSATAPILLKFPNEGAVITTGPNATTNRRIYYNGTVEPNTTYTLSYWLYSSAVGSITNYFFTYKADGTGTTSPTYSQGFTTGQWVFIQHSFTTPADTGNTRSVNWGPVISPSVNSLFAMQRFQVEAKSHATQFVNGTRSATQGLLDLKGNSTLNLSNVSFDSNAQMTWDGTNDQIALTGFTQPDDPNIYTVEALVKLYAHNPGTNIGSVIVNNYSALYGWIFYLKGPLSYLGIRHHDGGSGGYDLLYGTGINLNQWYHIAATDDKTTVRLYLNGVQVASRASATALNYSGQPLIGQFGGNNAVTNGDIPVVKIYNRALTAAEVANNYNHYKGRFNI